MAPMLPLNSSESHWTIRFCTFSLTVGNPTLLRIMSLTLLSSSGNEARALSASTLEMVCTT
eukprot:CAMPEP_0172875322 /NCGR_PEP_ID=MMETSP1075-20121228/101237_1 /TAXON_ID=2916 /ORGANISM="Ceratium fusus, Strain PA161109" /LENGTH=60 /DNA_ID=CAMNT_0013726357 /DNA_START=66 /DNA_END=244 /DNA_ORIENTATION=+